MSGNRDEDRNAELRTARDAYGTRQSTADDPTKRDNAHFIRLANDEIVARKGTK
jgi:hypothetical protein